WPRTHARSSIPCVTLSPAERWRPSSVLSSIALPRRLLIPLHSVLKQSMESEPMLGVELVYALPDTVWRKQVALPVGATAFEAVQSSGVLSDFPELDSGHLTLGIFGRLCTQQHVLRDGDRVE